MCRYSGLIMNYTSDSFSVHIFCDRTMFCYKLTALNKLWRDIFVSLPFTLNYRTGKLRKRPRLWPITAEKAHRLGGGGVGAAFLLDAGNTRKKQTFLACSAGHCVQLLLEGGEIKYTNRPLLIFQLKMNKRLWYLSLYRNDFWNSWYESGRRGCVFVSSCLPPFCFFSPGTLIQDWPHLPPSSTRQPKTKTHLEVWGASFPRLLTRFTSRDFGSAVGSFGG